MLRWYYSVDSVTVLEITDRVDWPQIEVGGKANQDSWTGDLIIDDPAGDLIPLMFRRIYAVQDAAPAGGQVIGNWFITDLKVRRTGNPRVGTSRTWIITMTDENSLLSRRKFVGSDANRPAETDIARLRWALTTTELNVLDPDETYIDTTNPVALDAADLRQQGPDELMTSLTAASGKQCWVMYREDLTPHVYTLWYANQNTSPLYVSTLSLSNVGSEVDDPATSLIYPLSGDAELDRAGGRMASGLVAPYKTSWIYLQDTDVGDTYAYVDRVAGDFKNVSTLAKATSQVTRELRELALPDDEITTTWTVEEANLNLIKHGMIVTVHASHFPNYTDDSDSSLLGYLRPGYAAGFVSCRVMERTIRQVGPTTFEVPLRLQPVRSIPCIEFAYPLTPAGYYPPLYGYNNGTDPYIFYWKPGQAAPIVPQAGWGNSTTRWHFGTYHLTSLLSPTGFADSAAGSLGNTARCLVVGSGTIAVHTVDRPAGTDVSDGGAGPGFCNAQLKHQETGYDDIIENLASGSDAVFEIDASVNCINWVDIVQPTMGGSGVGFAGFTWTPA